MLPFPDVEIAGKKQKQVSNTVFKKGVNYLTTCRNEKTIDN